MIGGGLRAAPTPIVTAPVVEYDELDLEASPTFTTPHRIAILPFSESPDCADRSATTDLPGFVLSVVEEECPIIDDLLVCRVIAA